MDDFLDDITVATGTLVMNLLNGVVGAQLNTRPYNTPQLLRHLGVASLHRTQPAQTFAPPHMSALGHNAKQ